MEESTTQHSNADAERDFAGRDESAVAQSCSAFWNYSAAFIFS
jgi:hypothetical protein